MITREIKVGDRLRHNGNYGEIVVSEIVSDDGGAIRDAYGKLWTGPFVYPDEWQHVDEPQADPVNHPPHYTRHPSGVECIQITEHMGFCLGNAVKYIWRADLKHDAIEDLKKARWYIEREIARREGNTDA
jgi:hypothetical protein